MRLQISQMKAEYEMQMNQIEMNRIRWTCGIKLNERKRNELKEICWDCNLSAWWWRRV